MTRGPISKELSVRGQRPERLQAIGLTFSTAVYFISLADCFYFTTLYPLNYIKLMFEGIEFIGCRSRHTVAEDLDSIFTSRLLSVERLRKQKSLVKVWEKIVFFVKC